ncbi:MAG: hypothetical protein J7448_08525 [Thermomicrobium sp.]|nr:hypothetical protein [Thermomicrobium sp.]
MDEPMQPPALGPARQVDIETAGWIALALEAIFGYFGILGVGHAYAGRLGRAIGLLVGWLVVLVLLGALTGLTFGVAACLVLPIWVAVPVISGLLARRTVLAEGRTGSWTAVFGLAGVGCLGVLTLICLGLVLLGGLGALSSAVSSAVSG